MAMIEADEHITFSVVIPVYNGERTIRRAVDSVLAQSYKPMELIVTDDASTDGTVALLRQEYGDVIKIIVKQINEGSSAARNDGIDAASGRYIAFLDADDLWHKDKLKAASEVLMREPGIALLFHGFTQRDIAEDKMPDPPECKELSFLRLLPGNMIAPSCTVMLNEPEFRFERHMRYTEDYELWLRICYRHKVCYMPYELTQLFRAFTSGGGISSNRWKMRKGELKAYAGLLRLNPLFGFIVPVLWANSLLKHVLKGSSILSAGKTYNKVIDNQG
jgi:glycosyltransferase involved in cell wall biosynthesis